MVKSKELMEVDARCVKKLIQRKERRVGMISLKCPSCGSDLEMDVSKLMAVCPYCGRKMTYDTDVVSDIYRTAIIEGEKTNRAKIENDTEKYKMDMDIEKRKQRRKDFLAYEFVFIFMFVFCILLLILFQ